MRTNKCKNCINNQYNEIMRIFSPTTLLPFTNGKYKNTGVSVQAFLHHIIMQTNDFV